MDSLLEQVRISLWRDTIDHWFPACLRPHGFHQCFDRSWIATGGADRFLVFQARMTWTCSSIAAADPQGPFGQHARHGLAVLERMMQRSTGAFYWEVDATGRPVGRHSKGARLYGQAFAIYGLAAAARALGDDKAKAAAIRLFAWLERSHHDPLRGGWFEYVRFSGRPFFRTRVLRRHVIGGYKTSNSHLHLLEAFLELYRLWPDPLLRQRIEGLIDLFVGPWWQEPGRISGMAGLDCRPLGGHHSYGHDLSLAHLLLDAAAVLGRPDDSVLLVKAEALVQTALREAWNEQVGGFLDGNVDAADRAPAAKLWWVQAEGLAALAALYGLKPHRRARDLLDRQWEWIEQRQIDRSQGGWFETVAEGEGPVGDLSKGKPWKEIYHELRAALVLARSFGVSADEMLVRPADVRQGAAVAPL